MRLRLRREGFAGAWWAWVFFGGLVLEGAFSGCGVEQRRIFHALKKKIRTQIRESLDSQIQIAGLFESLVRLLGLTVWIRQQRRIWRGDF